jgi:alkanesulfonate monooxygenase SsuD/methylene tetrahydromethanopterin reductase-like flavin-dependent oxidoreductase (luciferase family)
VPDAGGGRSALPVTAEPARDGGNRGVFQRTISLGLQLHPTDLTQALTALRNEAIAAEEAGFDGITLSEHHAGFAGYVPAPTTLLATLLGTLSNIFVAPCPTLLPLRRVALLAEEIAWLSALNPGRVGVGVASGYQQSDFDATSADFGRRSRVHWELLPQLVTLLRGHAAGALADDPAIAACAIHPVDVVTGVGGHRGVERAAAAGAGVLITSLMPAAGARELFDHHERHGGPPLRVLIRRVSVGDGKSGDVHELLERYRGAASSGAAWLGGGETEVLSGSPADIAHALADAVQRSAATALNVRVQTPQTQSDEVLDQLRLLGEHVLPELRQELGWPAR